MRNIYYVLAPTVILILSACQSWNAEGKAQTILVNMTGRNKEGVACPIRKDTKVFARSAPLKYPGAENGKQDVLDDVTITAPDGCAITVSVGEAGEILSAYQELNINSELSARPDIWAQIEPTSTEATQMTP